MILSTVDTYITYSQSLRRKVSGHTLPIGMTLSLTLGSLKQGTSSEENTQEHAPVAPFTKCYACTQETTSISNINTSFT